MNLIIILTIIVLSLLVLIVCIVKNFKNNQLQFNNSYSNNKSSSNLHLSNKEKSPINLQTPRKPKKKIYYSEAILNKQEFYIDRLTHGNDSKKIHASLQIGEGDNRWSRMTSTTTPEKGQRRKYIQLDNPTKNGEIAYLNTQIRTSKLSTRLKLKKNHHQLTQNDLSRIKKVINRKLRKN